MARNAPVAEAFVGLTHKARTEHWREELGRREVEASWPGSKADRMGGVCECLGPCVWLLGAGGGARVGLGPGCW